MIEEVLWQAHLAATDNLGNLSSSELSRNLHEDRFDATISLPESRERKAAVTFKWNVCSETLPGGFRASTTREQRTPLLDTIPVRGGTAPVAQGPKHPWSIVFEDMPPWCRV
jgi:hypothetical protein